MTKRYVLGTRRPVEGNCNHLLPSGHYCSHRVRAADHCAAGHPVVHSGGATVAPSRSVGAVVDVVPELDPAIPLVERLVEYGGRLERAFYRLERLEQDQEGAAGRRIHSKRYVVHEAARRFGESGVFALVKANTLDEAIIARLLAGYVEQLRTEADRLARPADADDGDEESRAGWAEGIALALSHLEDMDLLPEEVGDEPATALDLLDSAIDSLPESHRDRPGLVRARELLRTERPVAVAPPTRRKKPSLPVFKVGDRVQVQDRLHNGERRAAREYEVTKVGRKWVTIDYHGRPTLFDPTTGKGKPDGGAAWPPRIVTPEIAAYEEELEAARLRFRFATGAPGHQWWPPSDLSISQLQRLADILEEPRGDIADEQQASPPVRSRP